MARISKAQLLKLQKKYKTDAAIGEQFGLRGGSSSAS